MPLRVSCRPGVLLRVAEVGKRWHIQPTELPRSVIHDYRDPPINGSERNIRCYLTKRNVSRGISGNVGRGCRNAFLGLARTCAKLSIAFWACLGSRLGISRQPAVPPLADLIRCRGQPA